VSADITGLRRGEMRFALSYLVAIIVFITFTAGRASEAIQIKVMHNRSMVNVKIGELIIPDILLDTGFDFDGVMIYNPDYNDSIAFPQAMEVKIPGAGSGEPATAIMVDSAEFMLGNITLTNQKIIILTDDTFKGFPSNGIIGYSVFGHYMAEFNYDNKTIILHDFGAAPIDSSWTNIPIYFKHNKIPWTDVSVVIDQEDPILLSAYIDFAAGDVIELLEKEQMKFNLPAEMKEEYLGRGLSGDIYGKSGRITKLIIGPYELTNVRASIAPAQVRSKQKDADAIIGSGSLRRFNLIFDYYNKQLYLKPNSQFHDPF
jgi:hypothetical protein